MYGVPLYREEVMKMGMVAANVTVGETEELPKAMRGKQSETILAGMTARFETVPVRNGWK
jgi:error-prone DNA polymerase